MMGSVGVGGRTGVMVVTICALLAAGCGREGDSEGVDSVGAATTPVSSKVDGRRFVLPETDSLSLLDAQVAGPQDDAVGAVRQTFALAGSPDDDGDGLRVSFGLADAAGMPIDDVVADGVKVVVDSRSFVWVSEGENQRVYVGPTPDGGTIAMATLNVDEAMAVDVLATAELSSGDVLFNGQSAPDGWVDTGTLTTLLQFVSGATGSSTPPGGTRALYGDPDAASGSTWDGINGGFGVTLATWPVTGSDPENEVRYNLDGEVEVEIGRADGTVTIGFASPADSEFVDFVVWQDGSNWLALSRPASVSADALLDLAATVGEANADEVDQLDALAVD